MDDNLKNMQLIKSGNSFLTKASKNISLTKKLILERAEEYNTIGLSKLKLEMWNKAILDFTKAIEL
jgi:hypothetical protein